MNRYQKLQLYGDRLRNYLRAQKETALWCMISVFIWGLLAHAYGFLHCNLSHDALNAFVATPTEEQWKIELGRFFVPTYRAVFRGGVTLPWVIGMLGLFWTAVAVFLVIRIFVVRPKRLIVLIAGIMVTNVTYISQIAAYLYEFDFNAFSLLLAVCAVYFWEQDRGIVSILLGGIFLMLSIGIYQAYFSVALSLIIWKSVMDLFDDQDTKAIFFHGLRGIAVIAMGCLLYFLVGKIIYSVTGITPQTRTDVFSRNGLTSLGYYLSLIKPSMWLLLSNIMLEKYLNKYFWLFVSILTICVCTLAIWVFIRKKYRFGKVVLIFLLTAATPLAMGSIYLLAYKNDVHELMLYSVWLFYIFLLLVTFRFCDSDMVQGWLSGFVRCLSCIVVCFVLWQNVLLANTAYIKKEGEAAATFSTMTRAVAMLERHEEYKVGETTVAFIGSTNTWYMVPGMERISKMTGLDFYSSIPKDDSLRYYNLYRAYFDYVLQYPIQICSDDVHQELKLDPRVAEMPVFPDSDCVQMIGNVLVVKMGEPSLIY